MSDGPEYPDEIPMSYKQSLTQDNLDLMKENQDMRTELSTLREELETTKLCFKSLSEHCIAHEEELADELARKDELLNIAISILQDGVNIIAFPGTDFMKVKAAALFFLSDKEIKKLMEAE